MINAQLMIPVYIKSKQGSHSLEATADVGAMMQLGQLSIKLSE